MSARVDQREVLDRLADIVETADFEMTYGPVERCECGAALLRFLDKDALYPVCAGCLLPPTYQLLPAPSSAETGECERDADLTGASPDGGASGNAARSLNLRWSPWRVGALIAIPAVFCVLILAWASVA